jgi:outer membrane protein W
MKKLLTLLFTICVFAAQSQNLTIGPKFGANVSTLTGVDDADFNTGLAAGVFLLYSTNVKLGIGLDAFYSEEGTDTKILDEEINLRLNYMRLNIPVSFFFRDIGDEFRPKVFIGPTLGFLMSAEVENGSSVDVKDFYNSMDIGALVGLGFNNRITEKTWLNIDASYKYGFIEVRETAVGDAQNNHGITISIGIGFGL